MQPVLWKVELLQLMSHLLQILHSKDEDLTNGWIAAAGIFVKKY